ncbi:hypothetical protein OsI_25547 [Oryza sativa Indica Group]|uniref:Uncharacterized protein n=1 Tax=Oryza sativa subsp. indica TaxID=39946 RepID=A2YJZ5_ORYSI|nr:hypothetical protein OsI_25547 [Oryza sativa Indica Group]
MAELTEGTCEGAQGCRMYMRLRWSPNLRRCVRSMSRLSRGSDQGQCRSWQASEKPRSCGIRILYAQLRWRLLGRGATLRVCLGEHKILRSNWLSQLLRIWKSWASQLLASSSFTRFYNYSFLESGSKSKLFGGASDSERNCSS